MYLHINDYEKSYEIYINDAQVSGTGNYEGSPEAFLGSIRFGVQPMGEAASNVYLDYIRAYKAKDFVLPKAEISFDGNCENALKTTGVSWSFNEASRYYIPELTEEGYGVVTSREGAASYYALNLPQKNITGEYVVETRVKFANNKKINFCIGATNGNAGYINFQTVSTNQTNCNSWLDATSGVRVGDAIFYPDAVPNEPDYNMGWNTIYVKINSVTGEYTIYVNDTGSQSSGYISNGVIDTKLNFIRIDCMVGAKAYVDYIKVYDAQSLNVPENAEEDVIFDFEKNTIGSNTLNGFFYYTNDASTAADIAFDPFGGENKCLRITGAENKVLDIPLRTQKAVIEFKSYVEFEGDPIYIQAAQFLDPDNKHLTAAYNSNGGILNVSSSYETAGDSYCQVNEADWNRFKFVIDLSADGYTVYTYINGGLVNMTKYENQINIMRITTREGAALYIDDFSVKHSMPKETVSSALYQNNTEIAHAAEIDPLLPIQIGYTIFNIGGTPYTNDFILAVYDKDNRLKKAQNTEGIIDEGIATGIIDVGTADIFEPGDQIKVFWWDSAENMVPVGEILTAV